MWHWIYRFIPQNMWNMTSSFWTYLYHPLICGNPNPKVKRDISIHPNSRSYSTVSEFWKSEFEEIFCDWEYFKKMLKMSFPGSGSASTQFFWKPKLPDDVQLVETVPSSVSKISGVTDFVMVMVSTRHYKKFQNLLRLGSSTASRKILKIFSWFMIHEIYWNFSLVAWKP